MNFIIDLIGDRNAIGLNDPKREVYGKLFCRFLSYGYMWGNTSHDYELFRSGKYLVRDNIVYPFNETNRNLFSEDNSVKEISYIEFMASRDKDALEELLMII